MLVTLNEQEIIAAVAQALENLGSKDLFVHNVRIVTDQLGDITAKAVVQDRGSDAS